MFCILAYSSFYSREHQAGIFLNVICRCRMSDFVAIAIFPFSFSDSMPTPYNLIFSACLHLNGSTYDAEVCSTFFGCYSYLTILTLSVNFVLSFTFNSKFIIK